MKVSIAELKKMIQQVIEEQALLPGGKKLWSPETTEDVATQIAQLQSWMKRIWEIQGEMKKADFDYTFETKAIHKLLEELGSKLRSAKSSGRSIEKNNTKTFEEE